MNINNLSSTSKKVKTIYHLADIHIRLLQRHKEYKEQFEKLYNEIKKDTDEAIVCVVGDIVHAKIELSPELVDLTAEFLENLSLIIPTFIILGNHDLNLNNPNRLDALSPLIKRINSKQLYFLKDSGIFTYENINFYNFSISDPEILTNLNSTFALDEKQINIALYHGLVHDSKTEKNLVLKSNTVTSSTFQQYDLTLLGDIHKFQSLGSKNNIVYPSSLIQQDHGETYGTHGLVKWNIQDKNNIRYNQIILENDYGFHTIHIENDKIIDKNIIISKYPKIQLEVKNTKLSELKRLEAKIKKKYKVSNVTINTNNIFNDIDTSLKIEQINNINNPIYQNKLIKEFIKKIDNSVSEDVIEEISQINSFLNYNIRQENTFIQNNEIRLLELWFSNYFTYGENNYINLENKQGLIGLFANNASGKSSLIQIILFTLFDKTTNAVKSYDILNTLEKYFHSKIKISINGKEYFIEKLGEKLEGRKNYDDTVVVSTDFYYYENEEKILLNGEQRRDTQKIIKSYIGNLDSAILTSISLQGENGGLILKNQTERKLLLSKFLNFDIFEKLFNLAKEESKEEAIVLKNFQSKSTYQELINYKDKLDEIKIEEESILLKLEEINQKINENEKIIKEFSNNLYQTDIQYNISDLLKEKDHLEKKLLEIKLKIEENEKMLKFIEEKTINLNENLSMYNLDELNEEVNSMNKIEQETSNITIKLKLLENDLKNQNDKLIKLKDLKYDENCSFCMNNIFVKDAIATKDNFEINKQSYLSLSENLEKLNSKIHELKKSKISLEEYNLLIKNKNELKQNYINGLKDKEILEGNLKLFNLNYKKNSDIIKQYYEQEELILNNSKIQNKIEEQEIKLKKIKEEKEILTQKERQIFSNKNIIKNKIEELEEKIEKIKKHEQTFKAYELYMQAIGKNGIPYNLLKQIIPILELEVNNILNQIADFNLKFIFNNNNIAIHIQYNNRSWNISLASGMEKFISSIAMRVVLDKFSSRPSIKTLIIDEGFDQLDNNMKNKLDLLFLFLKEYYESILIISHLEIMKDIMSDFITIQRDGNYSYIKN